MKTDRELLELAARAAGIRHIDYTNTDYDGRYGLVTCNEHGYHGPEFDPLNDDGDALRLAVKLRLRFSTVCNAGDQAIATGTDYYTGACVEDFNGDPYAATRRAIVRAAAAIGEGVISSQTASQLPEDNYEKTHAEAFYGDKA